MLCYLVPYFVLFTQYTMFVKHKLFRLIILLTDIEVSRPQGTETVFFDIP